MSAFERTAVEKLAAIESGLQKGRSVSKEHIRIKARTSDLAESLGLTPRQVGKHFPKNLSAVEALEVFYRLKTLSQFVD